MATLGTPLPDWRPPPRPDGGALPGRRVVVARLTADHGAALHPSVEPDPGLFAYLPLGPFDDARAFADWADRVTAREDPLFYAFLDRASGRPMGVGAFCNIRPEDGAIEVGYLLFGPEMARAPAATEAMALMMAWAFEAGYRRYEWKCNALNLPSRRAAQRLGFSFEGIHRQARVDKGHNRDTAWFSVIDGEWPAVRDAHARWLDPANFDETGQQRVSLSALTRPLLAARDPALEPRA
jgi:RimJ/RimL family protein N-acetyltransferase